LACTINFASFATSSAFAFASQAIRQRTALRAIAKGLT
jgi:hypothetical protein